MNVKVLLVLCLAAQFVASAAPGNPADTKPVAGLLNALIAKRPDIVGKVTDDKGKPLEGVSVMIYTAAPKEGPSVTCPSCYADCTKEATTDKQGAFALPGVDRNLYFRLLFVSPKHKPKFVSKVDPFAGPVEVQMQKKPEKAPGVDQRLQGRIIDPHGKPVLGAKIIPNGITRGRGTQFGGKTGTDPLAVTDKNGLFLLRIWEPLDKINVSIEARALAPTNVLALTTKKSWLIRMAEGATVTGRIIYEGRPMPAVDVSLSGKNRRSGIFAGYYSARTDAKGRFTFFNIPTAGKFAVAAKMRSVGVVGATVAKELSLVDEGATVRAGDLQIRPGHRLKGRVILTDGKPVPDQARLFLNRDDVWDSQYPKLSLDGSFDIPNLPTASINFGVVIPGYRVSLDNPSLDRLNGGRVVGQMSRDLLDFVVLMEPGGAMSSEEMEKDFEGDLQPSDKPLRSAIASVTKSK